MYCFKCGGPLREGAKFCGSCGSRQEIVNLPDSNSHKPASSSGQSVPLGGPESTKSGSSLEDTGHSLDQSKAKQPNAVPDARKPEPAIPGLSAAITGPIAAIIVAVIFGVSLLLASGTLLPSAKTYATVEFEDGYQKIGEIASETIYTQVIFKLDGDVLFDGNFDDGIEWLQKDQEEAVGRSTVVVPTTIKAGVSLIANAGIYWKGSESDFRLSTDSDQLESTDQNQLTTALIIKRLRELEQSARNNRSANAQLAIRFDAPPSSSFLLNNIARWVSAFAEK